MLRSMTGYGRGEATIGGRRIVFEIKSVNHKFFEFNSRITRGYLFLEDKLKAYVQGKISRGKVDVFLQIETLEETDVQVLVNHSLASAYVKALEELQQRYQLPDGPSLRCSPSIRTSSPSTRPPRTRMPCGRPSARWPTWPLRPS